MSDKWIRLNDVCWGAKGSYNEKGKYIPTYTVFHVGEEAKGTRTWEAWKKGQLLADGLKTRAEAMGVCKRDAA